MAEKLPSGNWRKKVTWTDSDGKRHSKSFTAPTKRELEAKTQEFIYGKKKNGSTLTVGQAVDKLIELNDSVYSPSTPRTYQKIKRNWMNEIANIKLVDLDDITIQRWINNLSKQYSPKTVSNAYGLLNSCRAQFTPDTSFHPRLPKRVKKDIEIPQSSDIALLLGSTKGTPIYICVLLGAHCGLRRSEMSALSWKDVDLGKKQLKVSKAIVQGDDNEWYIKTPKSYAGYRTLDMSNDIYEYFLNADKTQPPVPLKPNQITRQFSEACQQLGMDYHPHLLRHYFCSVCCNIGLPEAVTVKLMGHQDSTMVHQVYSHILNDFEAEARSTLINYMNKK